MRVAGIEYESLVDGPGLRTTIFFQGCNHHCKGCHNPETWDFNGGVEYTPEELLAELKKSPICHKVTLSGGDPLYQNEDELLEFISLMKKNDYTKIIIYTGFTMEEVIDRLHLNQAISDFKSYVLDDITLITDPFVESLKSYSTRFRGSSNQRVFHLTSSLDSHTVSVDEVTHKYPWEFVDHPVSVYCI